MVPMLARMSVPTMTPVPMTLAVPRLNLAAI
jgi:hypothetical protein